MSPNTSKKRKHVSSSSSSSSAADIDTSKPTAIFKPSSGRRWTLSIALPGSIILNAQSHDLKTTLAGQIARALAVFCVDEIVIFSDEPVPLHTPSLPKNAYTGKTEPGQFLAHLLSYLETPPFLRRSLFPEHENLRFAGKLPSLDMPHHLRAHEWCEFREGVTVNPSSSSGKSMSKRGKMHRRTESEDDEQLQHQSLVYTGLKELAIINVSIPLNTRVTVRFDPENGRRAPRQDIEEQLEAEAVAPSAPREEAGYYWGYAVRNAESLSAVFTECPFDGGYDLSIGTSERGEPLSSLQPMQGDGSTLFAGFEHLIVVFGGVAGLEKAVQVDVELQEHGVIDPKDVFDYWINVCPGQGSRTIRTEEAVWMALMGMRPWIMGE